MSEPLSQSETFHLIAGDIDPLDGVPGFVEPGGIEPDVVDKRVVLQSEVWVDRHGYVWRLADMSVEYRANVLRFLCNEAPTWVMQAAAWILIDKAAGFITADEARRRSMALSDLPEDWVMDTPLAITLAALNARADTPGSQH